MFITLMVEVSMGPYTADKRRSARDCAIRLYGIAIYSIPIYWLGLMLKMMLAIWLDILPLVGRTGVSDNLFDTNGDILYCIGESYANANPFIIGGCRSSNYID